VDKPRIYKYLTSGRPRLGWLKKSTNQAKLALADAFRSDLNTPERLTGAWLDSFERRGDGYHFDRQYVVLGWIVDFWCEELYLAIEIDGSVHNTTKTAARDQIKNTSLTRSGIAVARINPDADPWVFRLSLASAIITRQQELYLAGFPIADSKVTGCRAELLKYKSEIIDRIKAEKQNAIWAFRTRIFDDNVNKISYDECGYSNFFWEWYFGEKEADDERFVGITVRDIRSGVVLGDGPRTMAEIMDSMGFKRV
jgi:very-short-patch-repair endonuclease